MTSIPMVLGLNGAQKMGKSYNNVIELAATPEETKKLVMTAVTDPARKYRSDVGHPEVCNVFSLQHFFNTGQVEEIAGRCRSADIGCVDCKKLLAEGINETLAPLRERRASFAARPEYVSEVLIDGARRAKIIAQKTLTEVKEKMGLLRRGA
jgi:tryptophanyl-tRNA synthetase